MSKSPGRDRPGLTAANLHRRIEDATKGKNVSYGDVRTDSSNRYPVKPDGKLYKHDFESQYGLTSGPTATTAYHGSHWTPEDELLMRQEGLDQRNPYNVPYIKKNMEIPMSNRTGYALGEREEVASMLSEPYKRAEARREAEEYAKKSCWQKLIACFRPNKSKKNMPGGSIGGAGVTIKDLREFLDAHSDIKNILKNDECPLDPTEQMNDDADNFANMLENSVNPGITIEEIYNQEAGKRRKKTRKAKRRHRKTRKATGRTKRRN